MNLALDTRHNYARPFCDPSRCHLRVYLPEPGETARPPVVIATQYWDNPGTSITNMAEDLASYAWNLLGRPSRMVWFENYEHLPRSAGYAEWVLSRIKSEFDRVEFDYPPDTAGARTDLASPRWKAVSRQEVEALVGQPIGSVQAVYPFVLQTA